MSRMFLRNYLSRPTQVGAVWPSSRHLSKMIVDGFDWENIRYAVEYGPGTGVVTPFILQALHREAKFFAIERNPEFCDLLRKKFPALDLAEDSVENVIELCRQRNFPRVDAIVSGLPWATFNSKLQESCLDAMMQVLPPGGRFATFAYWNGMLLPAAQQFKKRLRKYFSEVKLSPTVWRNVPPAFVYRCVR
jgi:phosphatidylethanolamine/phosphatidyl-N-methylethanolamine N-methyltransferase